MMKDIKSIMVKITDPYTIELVMESKNEYKERVRTTLAEYNTSKQEIIEAVYSFKKSGFCSFIPNIAGFMVRVGLLEKDGKDKLDMVIEVIEENE